MRKLAIVASHPVQYHAPLYRALAAECGLTVFFCHRLTAEEQGRAGFGHAFEWDVPLLDGYHHEWLDNVSRCPGVHEFSGCDTPGLSEGLSRGGFDACLVSGWYLKSYVQAIRASRSLGIPVMVRGDSHLREVRPTVVRAIKYLPYRWLLGRIDAHLYVGVANYEYLRHYGVAQERLFFAPHFVDNDRFSGRAAAARESGETITIRAAWGARPSDVVFLFVGKLIEGKRVADFVAAVSEASLVDSRIRGVIVGSGPHEFALRSLVTESAAPVTFAGFCNQADLPARYAAADCLVLPSASESWGLVVNEGMAAGIPAIVSDPVGASRDLIEDGLTGLTYPAGAVDALASRMTLMAATLTENSEKVRAAVARRIGRYSCANAVTGTLEAMSVISRRPVTAPLAVGNEHA